MKLLTCCVFTVLLSLVSSAGLKVINSWCNITYNDLPKGTYYDYKNNIPIGANVWRNKLFITVPRILGVPSTLNYIPLDSAQKHNAPLIPYPNWNKNLYPDKSGKNKNFVSVYRVTVDTCDRLWFVDTGRLDELRNPKRVKPATLVVMDLQTDKIIREYCIPDLSPNALLPSVTVDVSKTDCNDAFAYIPDLGGFSLTVYSFKQNRSWKVAHNYLYLESLEGEFKISGHQFQWSKGVFSVELTDIKPDGYRDLYFHSMAGSHMFSVSTRVLRNESLAVRSYHGQDFCVVGDRGPLSQTSDADLHKPTGTMFLALINKNAVGCWNINQPLNTTSIVQKDDKKLIFPTDINVYNDKVYVMSNTLAEFLFGKLNYNEVNFRVWSNDIYEAIKGTQCDRA